MNGKSLDFYTASNADHEKITSYTSINSLTLDCESVKNTTTANGRLKLVILKKSTS